MAKTAFLFPGQASQYVGMAKDFYQSSSRVKALYDRASEILQYDLAEVSFQGPLEKLTQTMFTQPAILVHSLAILTELDNDRREMDFVAGHSLGEYSALACAGVLSFDDAIYAVRERSRLMQIACDATDGTMAALIGCEGEKLAALLKEASGFGIVQAANFNSPGQVAVSGERKAVEKVMGLSKAYGAKKAMPLKVGGAFHSPLMRSAQAGMRDVLQGLNFRVARTSVVTNVRAAGETNPGKLQESLVEQITAPVLWRQSIEFMHAQGVCRFIEIGPGKVLSGLVKRIIENAQVENIDTEADLKLYQEGVRA